MHTMYNLRHGLYYVILCTLTYNKLLPILFLKATNSAKCTGIKLALNRNQDTKFIYSSMKQVPYTTSLFGIVIFSVMIIFTIKRSILLY